MNQFLHGVARAVSESFALPGPILEIGSYQVPGQESIGNLRSLFPGREYIGVDLRAGPGVDRVARVEALPFQDGLVGTVLALSTFEHVQRFWHGFDEIYRVLRPDGALLVACPFYFYIHNYPSDYWRFTPAALEVLLENYPHKILGWHGAVKRPANVWALAFREQRPAISADEYRRHQLMLGRYARQPLSLGRRLRYGLGSLLFGRGHFAPALDGERWETVCRTAGASELGKDPSKRGTMQAA